MKCQRCLTGEEANYRAYTDAMELNVCTSCAEEARRLGIPLEPITSTDPSASSQAVRYQDPAAASEVSAKGSPPPDDESV